MKLSSIFSVLFLTLYAASTLQADVLASYTFTAANGNPTSLDTDLSDGVLSWEGGISGGFSSGTNSAYAFTNTVPETFSGSKYLEFTVSANASREFSLDSLVFDLGGQNYEAGATYTVNANIRSSVGAYASDLTFIPSASTTAIHTVAASSNLTNYSTFTLDLSGTEFNNLGEITFRLYPTDDDASGNIYRYTNIYLNGSTAVIPEPGTATLVLLSALGMLFCLRRKNK